MPLLRKFAGVILLGCAPLCAQDGSSTSKQSHSFFELNQSPQTTSEPAKKAPFEPAPAPGSGDSTALEAIKIVKAPYPYGAREKQLQGQVWVKILVSETGDVESAGVISGDPVLADAALQAVKKWKFKPFLKNGKPIKVSTKLPFDFAYADKVSDQTPPANQIAVPDPSKQAASGTHTQGDARVPIKVVPAMAGFLVHKVAPIYPEVARREHIQGVVLLQATISKEGRITNLTLISGPKELTESAIGAVQQWRYKPYMVNGEAMEVKTQVAVNFQLP
jgi:TonB family protein